MKLFMIALIIVFSISYVQAESCLKYSNPQHIVLDNDAGIFVKLSVKVTVDNRCGNDVQGGAEFKGLSNDFLVKSKPLMFAVKRYERKNITELWYVDKKDYPKIDSIVFEESFER